MTKSQDTRTVNPKGRQVKALRKLKGWRQQDLIEEIEKLRKRDKSFDLIKSVKTISRIENSKPCFLRIMKSIAAALSVPLAEIVTDNLGAPSVDSGTSAESRDGLKPVRLAIITSGNFSARTGRVSSFLESLKSRLCKIDLYPVETIVPSPKPVNSCLPTMDQWCDSFAAMEQDFAIADYIVTVGTQPSMAFRSYMGERYGEKPTVFLAVTDPVSAKLVDSVDQRDEKTQVSGVTFGPSAAKVVSKLRDLVGERHLAYVYSTFIPSDVFFAQELQRLIDRGLDKSRSLTRQDGREPAVLASATAQPELRIIPISLHPSLDEMVEKEVVYFSWYSLELLMFQDPRRSMEICSQRIVISTTANNAEAVGRAIAAVGPDNSELGAMGAELIEKHIVEQKALGKVDIERPVLHHWVNRTTALQWHIEFSPRVLETAKNVFE